MTTIVFYLCNHMLATSVALPLEQFRAAESMDTVRSKNKSLKLTYLLASKDGKPVRTHTGLNLVPDCCIHDIDHCDIAFLPALWRNPIPILRENSEITPWLLKQNRLGAIIAGVGTGCCFMAEAGLLDFRPATTHWFYFEEFARRYPDVQLRRQYFITHSENLFCAGSVNSMADLTIHFIQQLFDPTIARNVERHFFHEVRQAYPMSINEDSPHPDESIARAQSWMRRHSHQPISVKQIAAQSQMSQRTFNRRFKAATSQTPLQYLQHIRLRNAGDLLQTSNLSVSEVAYQVGYQDLNHFTALFKKQFGTTPSQYRTTVRAKLFSAL